MSAYCESADDLDRPQVEVARDVLAFERTIRHAVLAHSSADTSFMPVSGMAIMT